jgi:RNA polymerase-binding protein DksA
MKNPISFPKAVLRPIRSFLVQKLGELERRKKELSRQDPFADTSRLKDNAASDADAQEQFGHAQIEAVKKEIDRKLIQIRQALSRIKIGRYGICEKCGKMINTERLMVSPEATLCIECEKRREKS